MLPDTIGLITTYTIIIKPISAAGMTLIVYVVMVTMYDNMRVIQADYVRRVCVYRMIAKGSRQQRCRDNMFSMWLTLT